MTPRPPGGGLQAERTALAWNRTAVGLIANAALLSVRVLHVTDPVSAALPVALAVLIAAGTVLYSRHRNTVLGRRPLPDPLAVRAAPVVLGLGVVALALVSGLVLLR